MAGSDRAGRGEGGEIAAERDAVIDLFGVAWIAGSYEREGPADARAEKTHGRAVHLGLRLHVLELRYERIDLFGVDPEIIEAIAEGHEHDNAGAGGVFGDAHEAF